VIHFLIAYFLLIIHILFSISQNAKAWDYHTNDQTLRKYAYVLHDFAYAIIQSCLGHSSGYALPLTQLMKDNANQLHFILNDSINTDHIPVFHSFIYPFFSFQPSVSESDKWSMVLECWLAVYCLRPEGHFISPNDVTGIFAKLKYHCRAVTLYQCYLDSVNIPNQSFTRLLTLFNTLSSYQLIYILYSSLNHYCEINLKPGGLHPFNALLEYQRFASFIVYSEGKPPSTTLSSNAKHVSYKDKTMSLENWVAGMRNTYNKAIQYLDKLSHGANLQLNIPKNLSDDMSNSVYGYSWLDSQQFVEPFAILQHMMSNPDISPCFVDCDGNLVWNTERQLSWMLNAGKLNVLLSFLHHTVPGQPCRIAELCDFRIRNGLRGRNIFHDHGEDWLIVRRVKSESLVQHEDFIPVKLPPELAVLLRKYLLFIRPIEINFARRIWGQQAAELYHEYLYVSQGKRLQEDTFYRNFKEFTSATFKCRIGVRGYRQMVITIARAYLGTEYELELEEEDDALIKQRGHGADADRRCYGVQSSYLSTLSSDLMFRFGHMSEWWWRLTRFAPGKPPLLPLDVRRKFVAPDQDTHPTTPFTKHVQPSTSTSNQSPQLNEDKLAAIISASVATAVHDLKVQMEDIIQTKVAAGVTEALARLPLPQTNHHPAPISQTQSLLPSTPSVVSRSSSSNTLQNPVSADASFIIPTQDNPTPLSSSVALHWLKKLYHDKPSPSFRSTVQQTMVEKSLDAVTNFIAVLPTGGGKSLVFLIPAFAAQSTAPMGASVKKTLVIIPNKALLNDTLRKAQDLGISCCQWIASTSNRVTENVSLVLLAIESLSCYRFKKFVLCFSFYSLHLLFMHNHSWYRDHEHEIVRFVVDESHQIVTSADFRKQFFAVKELAQYVVQKIFITATLPPYLESHFLDQTYLPSSTQIIRSSTNRSNLGYHILNVDKRIHEIKSFTTRLTSLLEATFFSPTSRGVIFCTSRDLVDDIATEFGNTKSHSHMESQQRAQIQEEWYFGTNRKWMVATTGFIHGIDHPNVDAIIFVDMPYGLMNFVQGAGRAGRDGQTAHVFLLNYHLSIIEPQSHFFLDGDAIIPGGQYARNITSCRRHIISEVMDGIRVSCDDLYGATKCDMCNPEDPLVIASNQLMQPPPRDATPDYDTGEWDDDTLGNIPEDVLFGETNTPAASVPNTPPAALVPTLQLPPVSSTSSQPVIRSMALQIDQAHYTRLVNNKRGKVSELSAMTNLLRGHSHNSTHVGYCVICWAWKNTLVSKTDDHVYFIHCKSISDSWVSFAVGWINELKRKLQFARYKYCWKCGLPQGDMMPSSHPTFKKGIQVNCPFDDLVAVLLWYIVHDKDIWKQACEAFPALHVGMPLKDIVKWFNKEEAPHLFYNGLEVVIWYWLTFKKGTA